MNKKMAAAWLICFALLLLMPGAVWAVTKDRFQTDATENTVSTEIPKLTKDNYRDYPGLVESAFNAAVPFRSQLISFSSLTDLKLFCEKSINDKVVRITGCFTAWNRTLMIIREQICLQKDSLHRSHRSLRHRSSGFPTGTVNLS